MDVIMNYVLDCLNEPNEVEMKSLFFLFTILYNILVRSENEEERSEFFDYSIQEKL